MIPKKVDLCQGYAPINSALADNVSILSQMRLITTIFARTKSPSRPIGLDGLFCFWGNAPPRKAVARRNFRHRQRGSLP